MNKGSLKKKITFSFLILTIIVILVQGFTIYELLRVKNDITVLIEEHSFKVEKSHDILDRVNSIGIHLRDAVLGFNMGDSKEHIKSIEQLRGEIGEIVKILETKIEESKEKNFSRILLNRGNYISTSRRESYSS